MIKHMKKVVLIPIIILGAVLLGYLLLVGVYCLPTDSMKVHMIESSDFFEDEGITPELMGNENSMLDNHTDALMLLTASHPRSVSSWYAAVNANRFCKTDEYPNETLVSIYGEEDIADTEESYARYWHGYLIFLKPLLLIMNYGEIRALLMFIQLAFFMIIICELLKKRSELVFPFFITWIFLNPVSTMLSLQYNTVLIVTFVAIFFICKFSDKINCTKLYEWSLFFLCIGILTSYFDLLTYPLVTLGIPLIVWISIYMSGNFQDDIIIIIRMAAFWGVGYACMWASKWILGSVITGKNVLANAAEVIVSRTSSNVADTAFNYLDVIKAQISSSHQTTWEMVVICVIIAYILILMKNKKVNWHLALTFFVIALFPFVWYGVLKNHSYIHSYFTYRELAISICAFFTYIMLQRKEGQDG